MIQKRALLDLLNRGKSVTFVAILLLSLLAGTILPSQKAEAAVPLNFTLLGTHPQAAAQPTSSGNTINKLQIFDNKLFAAYGDYGANTGPIDINPFDLTNGTFDGSVLSVPSESIGNWRVINNKLYTTTIDATCSGSCPSGYAVGDTNGNWTTQTPINAEHVFDIETLNGTDLWMFGGSTDTAYAWRSTNGGANWSVVQTNNRNPDDGDDSERYYWGKALDGKMYMQADVYSQPADLQIYDGTNWTTGTEENVCQVGDSSQGPNPVAFDGKIICAGNFGDLLVYDADSDTTSQYSGIDSEDCADIRDIQVLNGMLHLLCRGMDNVGRILRTSDMQIWQTLSDVPSEAYSLAIDQNTGKIYVGTSDSKLYVADSPAADATSPTISITSPAAGSSHQYLPITSSANDDVEVTKVEYYLDDELVGSSTQSPYRVTWANSYGETDWEFQPGEYNLTAKAYDFAGNVTTSTPVSITIEDPDLVPESLPAVCGLMARSPSGDLWGIDMRGFLDGGQTPEQFVKFDPVTETSTYYPIPPGASPPFPATPSGLTVAPNGSLWYMDCQDQRIINIFPDTEVYEEFTPSDPVCGDGSDSLIVLSDGTVYNVAASGDVINKIDPDGNMSTINAPDDTEVNSLALTPSGEIILSIMNFSGDDEDGSTLAKMSQAGDFEDYYVPTGDPDSNIYGYSLGMDEAGTTWVGAASIEERDGFYLASITADGDVTKFSLPAGIGGRVIAMQFGANGEFYAMLYNGQVVRVTADGQFSLFNLLTPGGIDVLGDQADFINQNYLAFYAGSFVIDQDDVLWVGDSFGGRLLRIGVLGASTEEPNQPGSGGSGNGANGSGQGGLAETGQQVIPLLLSGILGTSVAAATLVSKYRKRTSYSRR